MYERAFLEGALDPSDFILAENLHTTIETVTAMPNNEYVMWRAYYVWKRAQQDLQQQVAESQRSP